MEKNVKKDPGNETPHILKIPELMTYMGIGRDQAYALMKSKTFPSFRLGRTYYVEIGQLERWLDLVAGREIEL